MKIFLYFCTEFSISPRAGVAGFFTANIGLVKEVDVLTANNVCLDARFTGLRIRVRWTDVRMSDRDEEG